MGDEQGCAREIVGERVEREVFEEEGVGLLGEHRGAIDLELEERAAWRAIEGPGVSVASAGTQCDHGGSGRGLVGVDGGRARVGQERWHRFDAVEAEQGERSARAR
jgi:hypothetical protein